MTCPVLILLFIENSNNVWVSTQLISPVLLSLKHTNTSTHKDKVEPNLLSENGENLKGGLSYFGSTANVPSELSHQTMLSVLIYMFFNVFSSLRQIGTYSTRNGTTYSHHTLIHKAVSVFTKKISKLTVFTNATIEIFLQYVQNDHTHAMIEAKV